MKNIALLGTGKMGAGIAQNILKAGYKLRVWNRTVEKAQFLVDAGVILSASPAHAVADADFILSCVDDDASSRWIWTGPCGVTKGQTKPDAIAIECTTISLHWMLELQKELHKVPLRFIDCPVTGGPGGARNAALTLLAGAQTRDLADATPLLEAFSSKIIHLGQPGAGTTYKLISNLMGAVQLVALAEGIVMAQKADLDLNKVIEALTSGGVSSPLVKGFALQMTKNNHDLVNFSMRQMHKDMSYALEIAAGLGLNLSSANAAMTVVKQAMAMGLEAKNVSVLTRAIQ